MNDSKKHCVRDREPRSPVLHGIAPRWADDSKADAKHDQQNTSHRCSDAAPFIDRGQTQIDMLFAQGGSHLFDPTMTNDCPRTGMGTSPHKGDLRIMNDNLLASLL